MHEVGHDNSGLFTIIKVQKVHLLDPLSNIVPFGNVHNDDLVGTYHGTTIGEGHISIKVIIINFKGYKLPIPWDATILGETIQGFMLWETKSL